MTYSGKLSQAFFFLGSRRLNRMSIVHQNQPGCCDKFGEQLHTVESTFETCRASSWGCPVSMPMTASSLKPM